MVPAQHSSLTAVLIAAFPGLAWVLEFPAGVSVCLCVEITPGLPLSLCEVRAGVWKQRPGSEANVCPMSK